MTKVWVNNPDGAILCKRRRKVFSPAGSIRFVRGSLSVTVQPYRSSWLTGLRASHWELRVFDDFPSILHSLFKGLVRRCALLRFPLQIVILTTVSGPRIKHVDYVVKFRP